MIDLETLDTETSAVVTSIGIVCFDRHLVLDKLEVHVDIQNQLEFFNRTINKDTLCWWLKREDNARKALTDGQDESMALPQALSRVTNFIKANNDGSTIVWGNGASFDNAILASLYAAEKTTIPWDYWDDRCYRTIKSLHKGLKINREAGVYHRAVDDAEAQAVHLIKMNEASGNTYL